MADYTCWSVQKLKKELSTRGARTTGRKEDLVERLISYERNFNFKDEVLNITPSINSIRWPTSGYKQLMAKDRPELPPLTEGMIDTYFLSRVCADQQKSGDFKALRKGRLMLEGSRVEACSMVKKDGIYFSGIIKASMKKKIAYNFRMKLSSSGEILNTDCECPAGQGPHGTCKHIAAILMAICRFVTTGVLSINRSCTEELQAFHRPVKTHTGSPLMLQRADVDDDPRPIALRNRQGVQDRAHNLTINCMTTMNMPRVTFLLGLRRADVRAATLDHDYLERPLIDYWVDKAIQVNETEAKRIERETQGQSMSPKWFEHRLWRLTSSHFGAVCLATARRNIAKLCKTITDPPELTSQPILHGRKYERVAIQKFSEKYNLVVLPCGLFIDVERPHLAATPDGLVGDDGVLEVKCPFSGRDEQIQPGRFFPYLFKDQGGAIKLKPWSPYMMQVQGQLHITKRATCYFVIYTSGADDLFVQQISYDEDFLKDSMLPKLDLFFEKYLKNYIGTSKFY